ncbi:LysM peptidoglycan-binding domain-containing protein [Lysinibacillus sp. KU-BSD001]|uniref:cell division suppressor protein YneA n=1 Tax=Lysinibacillus sp. KU-BSD001 TaxID=3141328 RepID=UPI0036E8AE25
MNWLKKNNYVALLLGVTVAFVTYLYITDEKIEHYEQITVQHGDTLWSLADEYRGKMSTQDWVSFVQKENYLFNQLLTAGQTITIPVEKDSVYVVRLSTQEETDSIKVASEQR